MIEHLLGALWPESWRPDGQLEIRAIRDGEIVRRFFPLGLASFDAYVHECVDDLSADQWDVYFGVLPRLHALGTNADVPATTPFLWADIDAKKHAKDDLAYGKVLALEALNAFPTPPHIIVDSGGGYHAYWLLTTPEPLERAQDVMRFIARAVDGDFVQDGARILRVPATVNWKRTPTVARYVRFDPTRPKVRLMDLEGQIPVADEPAFRYVRTRIDELPEWLTDLVMGGAPQGERSEAAFKAMVWLLRYGRTPEEIKAMFECYTGGIGAKMAEKTAYAGARWFGHTLAAAEAIA